MLNQEQFEKIELEHGCGYWNLCWEHACPCAITTENKGLTEKIYNEFLKENEEIAKEFDEDLDDVYYRKPSIFNVEDDYEDDDNCQGCGECICLSCENRDKCRCDIGTCDEIPLTECSKFKKEE